MAAKSWNGTRLFFRPAEIAQASGLHVECAPMLPQPSSVQGQAGTRVGQYILRLSGPITHSTVPAIEEALRRISASSLIIDLTEVPYIDSAAVGSLVQAYVSCQRAGRSLALVGLGHRVKALLQITRIDLLFTTFPTRAEAEEALA